MLDEELAREWATAHTRKTYKRKVSIYDSQAASAGVGTGKGPRELFSGKGRRIYDSFPYELTPPIVLVERTWDEAGHNVVDHGEEDEIEESVKKYKGEFAGT
jgi:hypothetical protein